MHLDCTQCAGRTLRTHPIEQRVSLTDEGQFCVAHGVRKMKRQMYQQRRKRAAHLSNDRPSTSKRRSSLYYLNLVTGPNVAKDRAGHADSLSDTVREQRTILQRKSMCTVPISISNLEL